MAKVELREICKVFAASGRSGDGKQSASHTAVDNVSLNVPDREFLVLLGPSGCGKSTTLRMIAGLDQPTSGEILIGGRVVNGVAPKDRDIAMVFQNYALYPHMNVYQNMAFGLELRFKTSRLQHAFSRVLWPSAACKQAEKRAEIDRRVHSAANLLGIKALLGRLPRQLSGGERQRVALGRAIVREPAAFLFDEPLSNLDAKLRGDMRREIKRLHQTLQTTVIYVTHDQIEALTLGDRVAVLNQGQIQQVGPPTDVYRRPNNRFVAEFLGTPPMNVVRGRFKPGADSSLAQFAAENGWNLDLPADLAAQVSKSSGDAKTGLIDIDMGFRPEEIRLHSGDGKLPELERWGCRLGGLIALCEPLGDAQLVHLRPNGKFSPEQENREKSLLVCKTTATTNYQSGDTITGYVSRDQLHFFKVEDGQRLSWGATQVDGDRAHQQQRKPENS